MRIRYLPHAILIVLLGLSLAAVFMVSFLSLESEAAVPRSCPNCLHQRQVPPPPSIGSESIPSVAASPSSPYKVWIAPASRKILWKQFGPLLEKTFNDIDTAGWDVHSVELGFRGGWVFVLEPKE